MLKLALKWSIIAAFLMTIWLLFEKLIGLYGSRIEWHPYLTNFSLVLLILSTRYAYKEARLKLTETPWTFLQGLKFGALMALFSIPFTIIGVYIHLIYLSPEFFPNMINASVANHHQTIEEASAFFSIKIISS